MPKILHAENQIPGTGTAQSIGATIIVNNYISVFPALTSQIGCTEKEAF